MRSRLNIIALACVALLGAFLATVPAIDKADAATPNYAIATPGVMVLPIHLQGQFTTTTAAVARLQLPFKAKVIGVSVSARASGGTTPTLTVNVKDDGTSILSSAVAVTAGSVTEASIDATKDEVADESVITIDLTITGTTPTWDDVDVLLTLVRI